MMPILNDDGKCLHCDNDATVASFVPGEGYDMVCDECAKDRPYMLIRSREKILLARESLREMRERKKREYAREKKAALDMRLQQKRDRRWKTIVEDGFIEAKKRLFRKIDRRARAAKKEIRQMYCQA